MEGISWSEADMKSVAVRFSGLRRREAQREAETILEIIDGDLNQAPSFSIFRLPQNPGVHTQNMASRGGDGGQEGVLDLGTLQWTPTSKGQAAMSMDHNGSGVYQNANSSTIDFLPTGNQALVAQRQGLGEAGGSRMDRAALERVAQLALEELARRER